MFCNWPDNHLSLLIWFFVFLLFEIQKYFIVHYQIIIIYYLQKIQLFVLCDGNKYWKGKFFQILQIGSDEMTANNFRLIVVCCVDFITILVFNIPNKGSANTFALRKHLSKDNYNYILNYQESLIFNYIQPHSPMINSSLSSHCALFFLLTITDYQWLW